ncbi:hypothetical protein HMPREF1317_0671 [Schaalia georgiae F0490]|uniref:Uncharacterized protein n=1 Tax=Schaalia georgiae F0490 TaxID=1125717 RepID=J1GY62_9ACTO|nr:hypothetical protein HMPREF1317_0671 [Schaalia georgiae F0490]
MVRGHEANTRPSAAAAPATTRGPKPQVMGGMHDVRTHPGRASTAPR